jgi:hypothetical protein
LVAHSGTKARRQVKVCLRNLGGGKIAAIIGMGMYFTIFCGTADFEPLSYAVAMSRRSERIIYKDHKGSFKGIPPSTYFRTLKLIPWNIYFKGWVIKDHHFR